MVVFLVLVSAQDGQVVGTGEMKRKKKNPWMDRMDAGSRPATERTRRARCVF
jgi:hypothetical protein